MQSPKDAQEHFLGPFTVYRSLSPTNFGKTAFCPLSLSDKLSGSSQKQAGKRQAHVKWGKSWLQSAVQSLKQSVVDSSISSINFHLPNKGMSSHLPSWCCVGFVPLLLALGSVGLGKWSVGHKYLNEHPEMGTASQLPVTAQAWRAGGHLHRTTAQTWGRQTDVGPGCCFWGLFYSCNTLQQIQRDGGNIYL